MEKFRGRREHLSKMVDALRDQLAKLQAASAAYWSSPYDPFTSPPKEAEIEYLLQEISCLVSMCAPDLWTDMESTGVAAVAELSELATGGEFGVKERKPETGRGMQVGSASAALSRQVLRARKKALHEWSFW